MGYPVFISDLYLIIYTCFNISIAVYISLTSVNDIYLYMCVFVEITESNQIKSNVRSSLLLIMIFKNKKEDISVCSIVRSNFLLRITRKFSGPFRLYIFVMLGGRNTCLSKEARWNKTHRYSPKFQGA